MFDLLSVMGFKEKRKEDITSCREDFNKFVYTPLDEAVAELKRRKEDGEIKKALDKNGFSMLSHNHQDRFPAIMFRNVITSNHEVMRFLSLVDAMDDFFPLLLEYRDDKFTDNNEWKHSLGKIPFYLGLDKNKQKRVQKISVIDFTEWNGRKISEANTFWGQNLVDFHHELFHLLRSNRKDYEIHDISEWLSNSGKTAINYYKQFLRFFIADAILFENFELGKQELSFTKEVFLPAFEKIQEDFGVKPLIVALEPTEIEGDDFWLMQPQITLDFVKSKMDLI